MRLVLLAVFAYAVTLVSSYGVAGTYERVLFWHAFEIDIEIHGGRPRTIGTGCASAMRVARCNFNQFITCIDENRSPPITRDVKGMQVDEMSDLLYRNGNSGTYIMKNVVDGIPEAPGQFPKLIDQVSKFIRDNRAQIESTSPQRLKYARSAMRRAHFVRAASYSDSSKVLLQKNLGVTAEMKKKIMGGRQQTEYWFVDWEATARKYPDKEVDQFRRDIEKHYDIKHWRNVAALTEALSRVGGCKT
ncbi:hypothetical protein P170DRAFT_493417 [Aspergillus steynii IBT 23096]|uniref:Uncharacterized protein n=1 Tax=Aspergillus steynii IBT 23096 TaxID=1392250 RepID=A0A2I2GE70_9EURO|nr:uncharacterized protein P170DRAFT_493417 [Aspergillus steynii IBT 23096]PLB51185.1 hypothetical protein P170DRAFT_493417 [Aspergillus steynii IBT 23096]